MVWAAFHVATGMPAALLPPLGALNRARRHRLERSALVFHRLQPGQQWHLSFRVWDRDSGEWHSVQVTYRCLSVPNSMGEGWEFHKSYFSEDGCFQWMHFRPSEHAQWTLRASDDTFLVWDF